LAQRPIAQYHTGCYETPELQGETAHNFEIWRDLGMTISGVVARFLAEEHKYKSLPKEVHLLGRQTIQVSLDEIYGIFSDTKIVPQKVEAEFDTMTRQAVQGDSASISDTTFFKLFGVESVRAVDHSDFEGADIVFDLTGNLPKQYENCASLIFDGSVMDNLFDPAAAMHNVVRMLRPGGRYIGVNAGSARWLPAYVAFNPYWFFDFFVANGFRDAKIYLIDFGADYTATTTWISAEVYLLDARANHREVHNYPISSGPIAMLIIAEKDEASTSDARISQGVYRLPEEWSTFDSNIERVIQSDRPALSLQKQSDATGGTNGFVYIGNINGSGLDSRNPGEALPLSERAEISLGKPFPGYGWGAVEAHGGTSWRWIDGSQKESVMLLGLAPNKSYTIEAKIHTARDMESINALRASCDGKLIDKQAIKSKSGEHRLVMEIPKSVTKDRRSPVHLGFSANTNDAAADGRSVALSNIYFYPKD
jgi:hypothetical protein